MAHLPIRDWPRNERPREKLLAGGPARLSDAELLAIFLRTGVPGKSAVDLARELLGHFRGLGPLLAADRRAFCAAPGLGGAKYALLQAAVEMSRRLGNRFQGLPFSAIFDTKGKVVYTQAGELKPETIREKISPLM